MDVSIVAMMAVYSSASPCPLSSVSTLDWSHRWRHSFRHSDRLLVDRALCAFSLLHVQLSQFEMEAYESYLD